MVKLCCDEGGRRTQELTKLCIHGPFLTCAGQLVLPAFAFSEAIAVIVRLHSSLRSSCGVGECTAAWRMNPRCVSVDANLCRSLSAFGQVGLAVDSRGDVALAGHVFEDGGGFVDGRRDAIVLKLASGDGSTLWTRCRYLVSLEFVRPRQFVAQG